MIEALRRNGVDVVECQEPLWHGIEDRVEVASGAWARPGFVVRLLRTYGRLLRKLRRVGDYDVIVLGYPGQIDAFLARLLTWLSGKPLVLDVFMSIYLIADERGLTTRSPLTARLIHAVEWIACRLPDRLILDTEAYVQWFHETYGLSPHRFRLVPTGADDRVFQPVGEAGGDDEAFRLLYYGTFIPNHGVEHIVEAARILRDDPTIHFELVGDGPSRARAEALVEEYGLENMTFTGWVTKEELPGKVAQADVCLGVFGVTPQSVMTIQNKIYECLAMRKPVITGDAPTIRASLTHGEHLYLIPREDGTSLAEAIERLRGDPALRRRLARQGHQAFRARYTPQALGERFKRFLEETASAQGRDG